MDAQHYYQYQVFRHQLTKLQAYKSSFQAWKCVSFGYALLATVLLSAKWHEVSTDLKLLHGIDQLLWQTSTNSSQFANNSIQLNTTRFSSITSELDDGDGQLDSPRLGETQWSPAVALAELLAVNATGSGGGEPANSSSAVLMSHMQLSLGRELNGNQLLKQEVEAFLAEFRSAKSTLSLSSLLVFVYIISWILMTLAVNDTRISNDVSLRNILLLSVFGAIDMAASVGFIMIRLIMYNFKSNTFVAEILGSATLRNSPVRLSPDQLTAFTALRLIAMRSCSAYVDAYVSVLVALLTILRLYAIVRAIAYYRILRRFNDLSRNLHHHHQLTSAIMNQTSEKQHLHAQMGHQHNNQNHHQATTLQGYISQSGAGVDLMRPPSHQWPASQQQDANGPTTTSTGLTFSPNANNNNQGQQHEQQLLSPNRMQVAQLVDQNQQQQQQQQQMILNEAIRFNAGATFYGDQMRFGPDKLHQLQMADLMGAKSPANLSVRTTDDQQLNKTLIKVASFGVQQQQARHTISNKHTTSNQRAALLVATVDNNDQMIGQPVSKKFHHNNNNNNLSSGAPNVLMVNGQPHRLIAASAAASELDARRKRHQFTGHESSGGFESEPVGVAEQRRQHLETRSRQRARSRDERLLLASAAGRIQQQTSGRQLDQNEAGQEPKQEQPSFTLLSASQLDRLSRKLLANATGSLALGQSQTRGRHLQQQQIAGRAQLGPGDSATLGGNRYKLIARYRPLKRPAASELDARQNRQQVDGTRLASQLIVQDDDEDEDDDELVPAATTLRGANKRRLAALLDDTSTSGNGGGGGGSSSGLATDSDDAPTATPPRRNHSSRAVRVVGRPTPTAGGQTGGAPNGPPEVDQWRRKSPAPVKGGRAGQPETN